MRRRRGQIIAGVVISGLVLAGSLAGAAPAATAAGTGTLSLYKAIENLDTGSSEGDRSLWDVRAVNLDTGEVIQAQGLNGFQSQPLPAGPYEISEVVRADSPSGYEFRDWACNGNVTTDPVRSIYLDTGQNLTCTVTNVAIKPSISLQKIVQGGSASPSLWTVTAEGPNSVSGAGQATGEVRIGRYHLAETGGPSGSGYVAGPWICTQTSPAGETSDLPVEAGDFIDVELGAAVSCSITNSADLPQLTLVKSVAPAAFPVDPPDVVDVVGAGNRWYAGRVLGSIRQPRRLPRHRGCRLLRAGGDRSGRLRPAGVDVCRRRWGRSRCRGHHRHSRAHRRCRDAP